MWNKDPNIKTNYDIGTPEWERYLNKMQSPEAIKGKDQHNLQYENYVCVHIHKHHLKQHCKNFKYLGIESSIKEVPDSQPVIEIKTQVNTT